jgi:Rieske Fe-S protein
MLKLSNIKIFVTSFLLIFSSVTCKKDTFKFPYVSIYATIGIDSDLGDLGAGSVKIYPKERFGGVGGLVIYKDYDENYRVFDAACTYDYLDGCSVEKSVGSFEEQVICPCCSSTYFLDSDGGYLLQGPATFSLKSYYSRIEGGFLIVTN